MDAGWCLSLTKIRMVWTLPGIYENLYRTYWDSVESARKSQLHWIGLSTTRWMSYGLWDHLQPLNRSDRQKAVHLLRRPQLPPWLAYVAPMLMAVTRWPHNCTAVTNASWKRFAKPAKAPTTQLSLITSILTCNPHSEPVNTAPFERGRFYKRRWPGQRPTGSQQRHLPGGGGSPSPCSAPHKSQEVAA